MLEKSHPQPLFQFAICRHANGRLWHVRKGAVKVYEAGKSFELEGKDITTEPAKKDQVGRLNRGGALRLKPIVFNRIMYDRCALLRYLHFHKLGFYLFRGGDACGRPSSGNILHRTESFEIKFGNNI